MTPAQQALYDKHGTPQEFAESVWRACDDLFITQQEAQDGIAKYNREWEEAGRELQKGSTDGHR